MLFLFSMVMCIATDNAVMWCESKSLVKERRFPCCKSFFCHGSHRCSHGWPAQSIGMACVLE